jgi:hypothetical protein
MRQLIYPPLDQKKQNPLCCFAYHTDSVFSAAKALIHLIQQIVND